MTASMWSGHWFRAFVEQRWLGHLTFLVMFLLFDILTTADCFYDGPRVPGCLSKEPDCLLRGLGIQCSKGCSCCYETDIDRTTVACCGQNITDIPIDLPLNTTHLTFINTGITDIKGDDRNGTWTHPQSKFCPFTKLKMLSFQNNNQLQTVSRGAFDFICPSMLNHLVIDTSEKLTTIEKGAFGEFSVLQSLKIQYSGLLDTPSWGYFSTKESLMRLDLGYNHITRIKKHAFKDVKSVIGQLVLVGNEIDVVEDFAFSGLRVATINLADNRRLKHLGVDAFSNTSQLQHLDLSNTAIDKLPTNGLGYLQNLTIQNVPTLKIFPPVLRFLKVENMKLTYPYHCCAFKYPLRQDKTLYQQLRENMLKECNSTNTTTENDYSNKRVTRGLKSVLEDIRKHDLQREDLVIQVLNLDFPVDRNDPNLVSLIEDIPNREMIRIVRRKRRSLNDDRFGKYTENITAIAASKAHDLSSSNGGIWIPGTVEPGSHVRTCGVIYEGSKDRNCTPLPDALNPCEDVMGYLWLRIAVWLVVTTALLGNLVVLLVTVSCKMTVGKFLMCNLAVADFCLGLYLLILAAYDLHTSGIYFAYAIAWQTEGGCQVAGFLSTFSTCLSIFTLSVITLERWYAISHAINLSKRLRMKQAMVVMFCGWMCALTMASLPLLGISSYGKTSLCLPMDTDTMLSEIYVMVLLIINALAFVVIAVCYFDMYRQVTNPGNTTAAGRNDANIAKRMAILVITDFACFFPIAFFGITAAAGMPLITVTKAKILLVFFFPLNSCANPFLYAIFTKQFKKDLFRNLNKCNICTTIAAKYRAVTTSTPLSNSHSRSTPAATTDQSWCGAICSCCICYGGLSDARENAAPRANVASNSSRGNNEVGTADNPSPVNGIRLLHGSAKVCLHLTISTKDFNASRRGSSYNRHANTAGITAAIKGSEIARETPFLTKEEEKSTHRKGELNNDTEKNQHQEIDAPEINAKGLSMAAVHQPSIDSELDINYLDEIESSSNGLLSDNETKSCSSIATQEEVTSICKEKRNAKNHRLEYEQPYTNFKKGNYIVGNRTGGEGEEDSYNMESSSLLCTRDQSETTCRYNTKC